MKIWPSILSDLFINLAAGWFGVILLTPVTFSSDSLWVFGFLGLAKCVVGGTVCLLLAELFAREGDNI